MREFDTLDDWALVNQQLRGNIRPLYNQQHRRQLYKMHDNLYNSVTELSHCCKMQTTVARFATVAHVCNTA